MVDDKNPNEEGKSVENEHENELNAQTETSNEEVANEPAEQTSEDKFLELNERFLRLHADFDNFKKRSRKEHLDTIDNANAQLLRDLLPILDDFERAIANNENADNIESVKEGFKLIHAKTLSLLASKGLKVMEAKGEKFDSDLHEAIANIPAPSDDEKGKVIEDIRKGYYLNEKVIRFAQVLVGQ
ncbi:MAG: nucleotide exchange factor GrpE [Flavobacteriia bacterium]|jgi:molecular chaperone GrpE|nr:nucleotide exchange factor GrpE [Cryomorphaceae bacterium]